MKICKEGNFKLKSRVEEKNGRLRMENINLENLKSENNELNKKDVKTENSNKQKEEILKKMLKDHFFKEEKV